MKKSVLISYALWGYGDALKIQESKDLKEKIKAFKQKNQAKTDEVFTNDLIEEFPELNILHDCYVRSKLQNIESNTNVIKVIIVICFIVAILGFLYGLLSALVGKGI